MPQQNLPTRRGATVLTTLLAVGALVVGAGAAGAQGRGGGPKPCRPRSCPTTTTTATTATTTTAAPTTSTTSAPDTVAPRVTVSAPTSGATVGGPFTVAGGAADDRAVGRVELRVDGGAWRTAAGTTAWVAQLDASAWPAGTHAVEVRAVDTAGNPSATALVEVRTGTTPTTGDPSSAPDTQGTWRSPEGVAIEVATAGPFTVRDVYRMLLESTAAAGDLDRIGPTLTIRVQDTYASSTTTAAVGSSTGYDSVRSVMFLRGVASSFASTPDMILAHEYGHAWAEHHRYLEHDGSWSGYLAARGLAGDPRLDSAYHWDVDEIIAEDYRLLFGSAAAVAQAPAHLNADIPEPGDVAGLRDHLIGPFRTG